MEKYRIIGNKRLVGSLFVDTSKNATLPIIAASVLATEPIIIKKAPLISDVFKMLKIIQSLGGKYKIEDDTIIIDNCNLTNHIIETDLANEIRSSFFMLGPMLAKFKKASIPYPGGCDIGSRPIDLHLFGLRELFCDIVEDGGHIVCDGSKMISGQVHLDFPSVGATENLMMSAVFLEGETHIFNAAREPEIVDLQNFINKIGGDISGAGTSTIIIRGVKSLKGGEYTPISDRIISGTYLIASAMTYGKVLLSNVNIENNYSIIDKLRKTGCNIDYKSGKILLECNSRTKSCNFETQPFPGFPTDLQPQFTSLLAVSDGTSIVTENLFETRYKHISELLKMGAKIQTKGKIAIIKGVPKLYGASVISSDLRGGAALVLAGLSANGETIVSNIGYIDRGYYKLEDKLNMLGADITRISQ